MLRRFAPFAADLWQHRELLWQFTLRHVELRHKGSHLGLIWSFLNPLLMLGIYVLVFGFIFGGRFGVLPQETRIDYGLGIFLGLTLFHFVSEVMATAPNVIVGNPNFVKKVVFPLEVLPAATVFGAVLHMVISLALVLLGIITMGPSLTGTALLLPLVVIPLVLLALGVSWFLSAFGVFYRDVAQIIQFVTMALMFASAVFYPAERIIANSPLAWSILRFNPVLLGIELARDMALWSRPLHFRHLLYLYAAGVTTCYLGHAVFRKLKPTFADVL